MVASELQKVVKLVSSEYRSKPYNDLEALLGKGTVCFEKEYEGRTYSFEINAEFLSPDGVRVRIHGEPPGIMGFMRGFAEYFGIYPNGKVVEGETTWF